MQPTILNWIIWYLLPSCFYPLHCVKLRVIKTEYWIFCSFNYTIIIISILSNLILVFNWSHLSLPSCSSSLFDWVLVMDIFVLSYLMVSLKHCNNFSVNRLLVVVLAGRKIEYTLLNLSHWHRPWIKTLCTSRAALRCSLSIISFKSFITVLNISCHPSFVSITLGRSKFRAYIFTIFRFIFTTAFGQIIALPVGFLKQRAFLSV